MWLALIIVEKLIQRNRTEEITNSLIKHRDSLCEERGEGEKIDIGIPRYNHKQESYH